MKWFLIIVCLWISGICVLLSAQQHIHVDQFGYISNADKVAVISDPQIGYNNDFSYTPGSVLEVRSSGNDMLVFSGAPIIWKDGEIHDHSGDRGWWFDFSSLEEEGSYYVYNPSTDHRSHEFEIRSNPYSEVLKTAGRMFYYNRSGMAKSVPYAEEKWQDGLSFVQDEKCRYIFAPTNSNLEKDLSGGWFDAGDYNKYVTFTYSTMHNLLSAYEIAPEAFESDWNIPESGNGIPDLLDEVKWELDFLLKMMNENGSVINKMGARNYNENSSSPPSSNTDIRYYGPTCTSAATTLASVFAHASIVFGVIPEISDYAGIFEEKAQLAFDYVLPFYNSNTLQVDCDNGEIVAGDSDVSASDQRDMLISASVYLLELSGDEKYNTFFKNNYTATEAISAPFLSAYRMPLLDALLRYTVLSNNDSNVTSDIRSRFELDVNNNYNGYFGWSEEDLYRGFMPDWSYHWGSNLPKASYGNLNLLLADYNIGDAGGNTYKAGELLHYFHGVNPQGMVYLTNMYDSGAEHCANEMYHNWFGNNTEYDHSLTSSKGPAPGYVVGGPNKDFTIQNISPPSGQPPMKSYLDFNTGFPDNSWEITEPAIYYQAAYVRLLASYVSHDISTSSPHLTISEESIELMPNPATSYFSIKGDMSTYNVEVMDISGQVVLSLDNVETEHHIDISSLGTGAYFVRLRQPDNNHLHVQLMIKSN